MQERILAYLKENRLFISLIGLLVVLFLAFLWLTCGGASGHQAKASYTDLEQINTEWTSGSSSDREIAPSLPSSSQEIMVDVKGAVRQPGVYTLTSGSRVTDAIAAAGGMTDSADAKSVNLAASVADEAVIYVATSEENISVVEAGQAGQGGQEIGGVNQEKGKVNLNQASSEELQTISGIGAKRAEDIIAYRESHGGFQSVDDLKNVSGIGDKTLEKIRDSVYVG